MKLTNILNKSIILMLTLIIFSACRIEKRIYSSGYYIALGTNKVKTNEKKILKTKDLSDDNSLKELPILRRIELKLSDNNNKETTVSRDLREKEKTKNYHNGLDYFNNVLGISKHRQNDTLNFNKKLANAISNIKPKKATSIRGMPAKLNDTLWAIGAVIVVLGGLIAWIYTKLYLAEEYHAIIVLGWFGLMALYLYLMIEYY